MTPGNEFHSTFSALGEGVNRLRVFKVLFRLSFEYHRLMNGARWVLAAFEFSDDCALTRVSERQLPQQVEFQALPQYPHTASPEFLKERLPRRWA